MPKRSDSAITYLIPVINCGEIVNDDHGLKFGATLMGMTETAFYLKICEVADFVEAEVRFPDNLARTPPPSSESCGCSS